jgi:hypothetical protein
VPVAFLAVVHAARPAAFHRDECASSTPRVPTPPLAAVVEPAAAGDTRAEARSTKDGSAAPRLDPPTAGPDLPWWSPPPPDPRMSRKEKRELTRIQPHHRRQRKS